MQDASYTLTLESLWQFSLQYYSVREIKEACLALQNRFHGNVNLLLLLKWLDEHRLTFSETEWHQLQSCLNKSENLLQHYRELRKKLKAHVPGTLYRETLEFELLLEKQQQSDLVECVNQFSLTENQSEPLTNAYCRHLNAQVLIPAFSYSVQETG